MTLDKEPEALITKVGNALGPLGRKMFKKLKVYAGSDHPHGAQNPQPLDLSK